MSDLSPTHACSTRGASGWSYYAPFSAWRFS